MKQHKGFERRIFEKFIITAILPVMLLLVIFSLFMWYSMKAVTARNAKDAARLVGQQVEEIDLAYRKACRDAAGSEAVIHYLESGDGSEKVFEKYYTAIRKQRVKFQFVLADLDKTIRIRSNQKDEYQLASSVLSLEKQAREGGHEECRIFSQKTIEKLQYYFGYGAVVYDQETPIGYLIYYVSGKDLEGLLAGSGAEEVIITNQYDTVLATTWDYAKNSYNKLSFHMDQSGNLNLKERNYYVGINELEAGFKIYACKSRDYEQYMLQIVPAFILIVFLVLSVFLFLFARSMSRRVTEPIETFMEAVKQTAKGKFDVSLEMHTDDEFEVLAGEYNRMVKQIDQLIASNNEKEELRRNAEFKVIRNQFNPHFIFNVLETLRYMIFVDQKQAEQVVLALSKFLRYNIYNQDKFVPLKEDLEHLRDFLTLHKARFQERMLCEIHMEEAAGEIFVPKFFVQPFVENSIKYGFRSRDHFHICICALVQEEQLWVSVKDDGGGMTAEKYQEVCERLKDTQYPDDHIGLYNINRMMEMIYGTKYSMQLINEEGEGLEILVKIPACEP